MTFIKAIVYCSANLSPLGNEGAYFLHETETRSQFAFPLVDQFWIYIWFLPSAHSSSDAGSSVAGDFIGLQDLYKRRDPDSGSITGNCRNRIRECRRNWIRLVPRWHSFRTHMQTQALFRYSFSKRRSNVREVPNVYSNCKTSFPSPRGWREGHILWGEGKGVILQISYSKKKKFILFFDWVPEYSDFWI